MQLKQGDRVAWLPGPDKKFDKLLYAKVVTPSGRHHALVEWEDKEYGFSNILEEELVKLCQNT
jgi:hypothetical protein